MPKYISLDDFGRIKAVIYSDWELIVSDDQVKLPDDIKLPDDVTSGNYIYNKETKQFTKIGGG